MASSSGSGAGGGGGSSSGNSSIRRNNSEYTKTLPTTVELDEEDDDDHLEGAFFMKAAAGDDDASMKRPDDKKLLSPATEMDGESSSASVSSTELPTPPDGGWGWVIVFASFMIHIIADGITYTFGIFVVELMEFFGEGRGSVSLIPSILTGVTLSVGPIASVLVNRFGCRVVTIVGAVIAAFGLAVSAATPNIVVLYVTIGLCTGVGFGLIYLPAIVSVSMYFEKKRAFATGIAVCGSGLGTFIMAPVTRSLIDAYNWDGAIIVTGAITLLCIGLGALFRPIPVEDGPEEEENEAEAEDIAAVPSVSSPDGVEYGLEGYNGTTARFRLDSEGQRFMAELESSDAVKNGPPPEIRLNGESLRPLAVQMCQNGTGTGSSSSKFGQYSNIARMALSHPVLSLSNANSQTKKSVANFGSHSTIYEKPKNQRASRGGPSNSGRRSSHGERVIFRKDVFYYGSLYNIPEYKNNPRRYARQMAKGQQDEMTAGLNIRAQSASKLVVMSSPSTEANIANAKTSNGTLVQIPTSSSTTANFAKSAADATDNNGGPAPVVDAPPAKATRGCFKGICCPDSGSSKTFSQMTDLSLLKDGIFIMFAVSNFLTSIGFNVPYVYTVDRAVQLGIDKDDASFLLSVVGIANTLGRIVLGYISDKPWLNRLYTYNISLAICGLVMALSNFCNDYSSQAFYCAVFGVTSGAYVGLTSVVLVDLLGLDKLTNAFGLLLLFQGIASVIGPPIIGALYDAIGNYDSGFYFAGTMIFLSGVMLFALPWMIRAKKNKCGSRMKYEAARKSMEDAAENEGENENDRECCNKV